MDIEQLGQAAQLRRMRADKAARALREARAAEERALGSIGAAKRALRDYDIHVDQRIAAYYASASGGVSADALLGARAFHADLVQKRDDYVSAIRDAEKLYAAARAFTARMRAEWAERERAAEKLQEMRKDMARSAAKELERRSENDADDLSAARAARAGE